MKKILSLLLAMVMVFSFISVSATLQSSMETLDPASISKIEAVSAGGEDTYYLQFHFSMHPYTSYRYKYTDEPASLIGEYSVNGGEWKTVKIQGKFATSKELIAVDGTTLKTEKINFKETDYVEFRLYHIFNQTDNTEGYSNPSNVLSIGEKVEAPVVDEPAKAELICSDWAKEELAKAEAVIPESLKTADLTKNITRAEFAAVAVKAYEALKGTKAQPVATNPFKDTNDLEVLKAYNIGITTGTSETTFEPSALLNREQAATMLTRAYSKEKVEYEKPATFADDNKIDDWAQDSVYFMASKGIINGVGDNKFAPDDNCSREQAIIIAARMVANLK